MTHTISFRRPELRHVLSKMTVPPGSDVAAHVRRLQDLGYQIVEVSPPLEGFGPGYQIVDVSPAHEGDCRDLRRHMPVLNVVRGAAFAPQSKPER